MNAKNFLITGLPRSRTAWFAAFMSLGQTICFHEPLKHPVLGTVHGGFYRPAVAIFDALRHLMTGRVSVAGHSLGAALSINLACLCVLEDIPVGQVFLFAPPRPGCQQYADFVAKHLPQAIAWQNGFDPVPEVPPLPFVDPVPLIHLDIKPGGLLADLEPLEYHRGCHYIAGLL